MAEYAKMKVKQLQDLLRQRGLPFKNLKKRAMIEALMFDEQERNEDGENNDSVADDVNGVDNIDEVRIIGNSVDNDTQGSVGESEQLTALRLQLEIAKLELQKAQLNQPSNVAAAPLQNAAAKFDLSCLKSRLPSMLPNCDVLSFFTTFERTLQINDVPNELWAKLLPTVLNERAMKLYAQLSVPQCSDYNFVRNVVIDAFKANAETYLHRLQTASRSGTESYKLFLSRLTEYQSFYFQCKEIDTFEKLKEDMILNLFMASLPPSVNDFVKARTPKTANDAACAADLCFAIKGSASSRNKADDKPFNVSRGLKQSGYDREQANGNNAVADVQLGSRDHASLRTSVKEPVLSKPVCFLCKQEGHKKYDCPKKSKNSSKFKGPMCFICGGGHETHDHAGHMSPHQDDRKNQGKHVAAFLPAHQAEFAKRGFMFSVLLNGLQCKALRDTGCNNILFNSALITDAFQPLNRNVCLTALFGQRVTLPLYDVCLQSEQFGSDEAVHIPAAAVDDLPFDVVIGNCIFDLPAVRDVIGKPVTSVDTGMSVEPSGLNGNGMSIQMPVLNGCGNHAEVSPNANVSTASVANCPPSLNNVDANKQVTAPGLLVDSTAGVITNNNKSLDDNVKNVKSSERTETDGVNDGHSMRPASNDCDMTQECSRLGRIDVDALNADDLSPVQLKQAVSSDFAAAQRSDPSLSYWTTLAERGDSNFVIHNGLLFKIADHWTGEPTKLLVVPNEYRAQVLELAHNSPFGGHLGRRKTVDRIIGQGRLIWPKLKKFVQQWIARCPSCQMVAPIRKSDRLPLSPIPRISTPFEDVSFDTLGSCLKATPRRNQYLLIHVDNASRYVDIIPMKNLKTETTIDALMSIWTRVGFPKKARFDQSSANMSKLMTALMDKLGIERCPSAVYLHHTSGLAERHIKTVSAMVRKFLPTCPRNWDNVVPILQMAINDTVCETTGLTPTEVLYGRRVRGPLSILREIWVHGQPELPHSSKNIISYLNELRQTLQTAADVAQKTAESQQTKMKHYYDQHATDRRFIAGQKALLLMPSSPYKIDATWTGPVTVVRAVDNFNYEVQLEIRKQIFHANMLKPYEESLPIGIVISADDDSNDDELPTTVETDDDSNDDKVFNIGTKLTYVQRTRIKSTAVT